MTSHEDIREYVINWNTRFPIDRAWRKKYNLAFNSRSHRESNFLDQLIDLEEDKLFDEFTKREEYVPDTGDWLKEKPVSIENLRDSVESFRSEFKDMNNDG